ncbi:MAG: hypothetical protein DCF16_09430 [Alphaproteobacteria bacterium]|nr:MAG: hypothetical protein DCF16_09430 [Alphaproteobacteria bacterium]
MSDWRISLRINSLAAFAGFGVLALGLAQDAPGYTSLFLQCGVGATITGGLWVALAMRKPRSRQRNHCFLLHAMPAVVFLALCASTIWLPAPSVILVAVSYAAAAMLGFQVARRWEA